MVRRLSTNEGVAPPHSCTHHLAPIATSHLFDLAKYDFAQPGQFLEQAMCHLHALLYPHQVASTICARP